MLIVIFIYIFIAAFGLLLLFDALFQYLIKIYNAHKMNEMISEVDQLEVLRSNNTSMMASDDFDVH